MNANKLYLELSKRDYSSSESDQYAQLLQTLHFHLVMSNEIEKFYHLLVKAHQQGKKIIVKNDDEHKDEFYFNDLVIQ